jgi:thiol-disulfide isomerase/thioredoxin
VPSYATSIEKHLTGSKTVSRDLASIGNAHESQQAKKIQQSVTAPGVHAQPMADHVPTISASSLPNYGQAPDFTRVTAWLNTTDGSTSLAQLRGKVVLVDFWTYSCINCLRSLPHVKAWYARYASAGFVVVGVHTPEFDFEHDVGNVRSAAKRLGVNYPVAVDDDYGTWDAWGNNSWPAEYLIDQKGDVRYGSIGEGDYGTTESAIRALLATANSDLPDPTSVADSTPTEKQTPESYLGYKRLARYNGTRVVHDAAATYALASKLSSDHLSYGGDWTVQADDIVAGSGAQIELNANARDIYLVLAGTGTVSGTFGGVAIPAQHVGGVPTVYHLVGSTTARRGLLALSLTPGVKAYDFTFG